MHLEPTLKHQCKVTKFADFQVEMSGQNDFS